MILTPPTKRNDLVRLKIKRLVSCYLKCFIGFFTEASACFLSRNSFQSLEEQRVVLLGKPCFFNSFVLVFFRIRQLEKCRPTNFMLSVGISSKCNEFY